MLKIFNHLTEKGGKMERIDFLKGVDIFSTLESGELAEVNNVVKAKEYGEGEVVFNENDPGDKLYIVESGTVEVKKGLRLYTGPQEVEIAAIPKGEVFGELALFDGEPRSAQVLAGAETKLLIIDKSELDQLFEKDSKLAVKVLGRIIRRVSLRLRKSDEVIRNLSILLKTLQSPL